MERGPARSDTQRRTNRRRLQREATHAQPTTTSAASEPREPMAGGRARGTGRVTRPQGGRSDPWTQAPEAAVSDLRVVIRLAGWARAHRRDAPLVAVDGAPDPLLDAARAAFDEAGIHDREALIGRLLLLLRCGRNWLGREQDRDAVSIPLGHQPRSRSTLRPRGSETARIHVVRVV